MIMKAIIILIKSIKINLNIFAVHSPTKALIIKLGKV
jgi:hypothetical protein